MKLPSSVKIGWADYSIAKWSPDEREYEHFGQTDTSAQAIRINASKNNSQVALTLLHEVMHGIAHVWEMPDDPDEQEKWIAPLASGLLAVWRDNPELIRFISDGIAKK